MENNQSQHQEGSLTKSVENISAKVPSGFFLCAALTAMGTSLCLKAMGQKHAALFVGQWVAPFLLFGIYNKIVKTAGSE